MHLGKTRLAFSHYVFILFYQEIVNSYRFVANLCEGTIGSHGCAVKRLNQNAQQLEQGLPFRSQVRSHQC